MHERVFLLLYILKLLTLIQEVRIKRWSSCMREGSCDWTAAIILHPEGFTWFSLKGQLWDVCWDWVNKIIYSLLEFDWLFYFWSRRKWLAWLNWRNRFLFYILCLLQHFMIIHGGRWREWPTRGHRLWISGHVVLKVGGWSYSVYVLDWYCIASLWSDVYTPHHHSMWPGILSLVVCPHIALWSLLW